MQAHWRDWFLLLLLASLSSACASSKPSEHYNFRALETADQSKRFTYGFSIRSLGSAGESVLGNTRSVGSSPSDRDSRSRAKPINFEEMREELAIYMSVTEYCNKGYFVYDETFDGTQYLLHGECQESNNNE